ncbi:MAG TPA: hypothetical protein LFV92_05705 [Rickettsia endosymbiont of Ceroptres masudai]|nr:hypothetical protein [Rickettsia endosymbiont of Ceroptres masudai]
MEHRHSKAPNLQVDLASNLQVAVKTEELSKTIDVILVFESVAWLIYVIPAKTIKNTNNFSIFNWIPWSSHGMTEVKLSHATKPLVTCNDDLVSM